MLLSEVFITFKYGHVGYYAVFVLYAEQAPAFIFIFHFSFFLQLLNFELGEAGDKRALVLLKHELCDKLTDSLHVQHFNDVYLVN